MSDVDLSVSCLANGKRRVRCSSSGDSPQYSWFLDGRGLSKTDADFMPDNQTLLLTVTGELTCSVRNHVSNAHTSVLLVECSGELFLGSQCYHDSGLNHAFVVPPMDIGVDVSQLHLDS